MKAEGQTFFSGALLQFLSDLLLGSRFMLFLENITYLKGHDEATQLSDVGLFSVFHFIT